MYTYMHTQTDWISDLKLRYLCFILLCGMYYTYTHTHTHTHTYIYMYVCMLRWNLCYFGREMYLIYFDGMREWHVSRIVCSKCFDLFDIYNMANTLQIYMRMTFPRYISGNKWDEVQQSPYSLHSSLWLSVRDGRLINTLRFLYMW